MKNTPLFLQLIVVILLVTLSFVISSCNKKFDEPPAFSEPDITANLTINDLKAMHTIGNIEVMNDDRVIAGVVIADDKSGNFYKTIVIEDETGGISLKMDGYDLYTEYPIGRKVYIKLKGLFLGDYNNLIELGGGINNSGFKPTVTGIAATLFEQYVLKGMLNSTITPKLVKVSDLNESYQNTLIQLNNFEFAATDTSKTFADTTITSSAINYTMENCEDESIILRNSSYSNFAGYNLPDGNGSVVAIYTVFGSTKQLNIRDTSDVKFYYTRCNG